MSDEIQTSESVEIPEPVEAKAVFFLPPHVGDTVQFLSGARVTDPGITSDTTDVAEVPKIIENAFIEEEPTETKFDFIARILVEIQDSLTSLRLIANLQLAKDTLASNDLEIDREQLQKLYKTVKDLSERITNFNQRSNHKI